MSHRGRARSRARGIPPDGSAGRHASRWDALLPVIALLAATTLVFLPVFGNGFVNWDDPFTIEHNARLAARGVFGWAFTTFEMGHYQPLAWLTWSGVKTLFGVDATAFHAASVLGHLLNSVLVYVVAVRLAAAAGLDVRSMRTAALFAALSFAIHPIRAEVVAWASAFPYVLSLAFTLAAVLAYVHYCSSQKSVWLVASAGAYGLSLASRANALALPIVLLLLDVYPLSRTPAQRATPGRAPRGPAIAWSRLLLEKVPFVVMALASGVLEWRARDVPTLGEIGIGARVTMAAAAPFRYVGRTLLPVRLAPIDPLPLAPRTEWLPLALAAVALAGIALLAWALRKRWPAVAVCCAAYVLLIGPVLGLTPSGQEATADRYVYLPAVVLSLGAGAMMSVLARRRWATLSALVLLAALGAMTWRQLLWWRDSVTLWTRSLDLDPRNDIASYNLAVALENAGRADEAIARYEQTLALVPDQELARRNRDRLIVQQAERQGDQLLAAGRLDQAVDAYSRALAVDAHLTHARANRGIALVRGGRFAAAVADLQQVFEESADPGAADALAFALLRTGRTQEAVGVLQRALATHPDDLEVSNNLARLLATAAPGVRNPALAVRLATAARDRTGGRDPRVLDTLAAAYAAAGQGDRARQTADEAVRVATRLGDADLAREISAHAGGYPR